jgi:hypothetical protein
MADGCALQNGSLALRGSAGFLTANCKPFSFKGVTWEGAEGPDGVPGGLSTNSLGFYMNFLHDNHFNAIRLPFNHKGVRDNQPIPTTRTLLRGSNREC